ncbi:MAG: primosomal protein N' [Candidatus Amulumruptor caecigallinarius]|nr:primosomal protein N' [Candidatus Amulumruptor caecigallinarius]MCM1397006.1 primosomal protein N' [Candidatus Amulumruptor caecigallinarius]MCM1454636.1 primosomal protein N' [bacterium]
MTYAEVLLPLPLTATFTYSVPEELREGLMPGCRVIVPFGRSKFYTGILTSLHATPPEGFDVKPIALNLDPGEPVVRYPQLKHWEWLADYYLCSAGDVYRAAMPAGMKVESETFVELNDAYEEAPDRLLSEREALVVQILDHAARRMTTAEIAKQAGLKSVGGVVTRLLEKGAVIISERLVERYRVKRETYVRVAAPAGDLPALRALFAAVSGAPKQERALQTLIEMSGFTRGGSEPVEVSRAALLERSGVTGPILLAMEKKGVVELYRKETDRFKYAGVTEPVLPTLTPAQSTALEEIHRSWLGRDVTLLHGVTSSGKTELYMHLIEATLRLGRQVLLLVPEIALTTQLAHRLQRYFGEKVLVCHSKFSDNQRVDIWKKMLRDPSPRVILGARSSVFLPFGKLGLVIVDEEHEQSYKQSEPAPRYNARDAAIVLATMHGAKVLLGSGTPSVESYYKATEGGKYGLVKLSERYGGAKLPAIEIVDLSASRKRGEATGAIAPRTRQLVGASLAAGHQAIMFISRRGYAPVARCRMCAYVPKCHNCDVSMTYHLGRKLLVCHYCGAVQPLPSVCPACHEPSIDVVGYGSERVEEEVAAAFPTARIARMDLDTTRNKDGYEQIINDFSSGKSDILVGTQMVTKGLDFGNVDTVAVVNADAVLRYPDFRSDERAFNMISQVAGRAGRRGDNPGVVSVQTYSPDDPVLGFVRKHDYEGFYEYAIGERRAYNYPPFTRMIHVYIKHRDERIADDIAATYATKLRELFGTRVQGPEAPPVGRIQALYIRRIMLKVELQASMAKVRPILTTLRNDLHTLYPEMRRAVIYHDVDPY